MKQSQTTYHLVGRRLALQSQPSLPPQMFLPSQMNSGKPDITDHQERTVFLPRATGWERTLYQGSVSLQLLGGKEGQGREGTAQQGHSPLLSKELKVRVRGAGDRRQGLPVFQSSAQPLPHTTRPLCRKHTLCHVMSSCAEPLRPLFKMKNCGKTYIMYIFPF